MTTANEVDMEALVEEAKELKIKGAHLVKDPDKLIAKIEAAKAEQAPAKPERKRAPKLSVEGIGTSTRRKVLEDLEAEDPECKYFFQPMNVTADQLRNKGLEDTGKTWRNNRIVRTDKDGYNEWSDQKRSSGLRKMESLKDFEGKIVRKLSESPKEGYDPQG